MNIQLITPAAAGSRAGNRATATRWAGFLRDKGHKVVIATAYDGEPCDLMLALHAWRSAASMQQFKALWPTRPLVLALTGTDIYKFQFSDPEICEQSMALADALIGLHGLVYQAIPECYHEKLHIVYQSAAPLLPQCHPATDHFDVCVVGHLRDEKDALRAAHAVRDVPTDSRLRVWQAGKAHNEEWQHAAEQEEEQNARYQWLREISAPETGELMSRCHLMVISSIMEGGANVVSEACVAGLPIIASDIPGNRGLLGEDYPGYYPPEDTEALRALLLRAEAEPDFVARLRRQCLEQAQRFQPAKESAALNRVIRSLSAKG